MTTQLTRPLRLLTRQFPSLRRRHTHSHSPSHPPPNFSQTVTDKSKALASLSQLLQSPDPPNGNGSCSSSNRKPPPAPDAPTSTSDGNGNGDEGGKWTLTPSRAGVQRTFTFKTFRDAWGFMTVVAERCKKERHHPEWFNCYNEVKITWTTHRPKGLSEKDILMARFCDEMAGEMGRK